MAATDPIAPDAPRLSMCLPRSLRIGVVAVVLVVFAIALSVGLPIYRQKVAIREIERVGGEILQIRPGRPKWLRERLRDDQRALIDEVVHLDLNHSRATDATLKYVGRLTNLELLWLDNAQLRSSSGGAQITDAGLVHIAGLTDLQDLNLTGTGVTDVGLLNLARLTRLEHLILSGTRVSDAGLAHLKGLTRLRYLSLDFTQVTDTGLAHLKGLASLRDLFLFDTEVSRAGVDELERALPKLAVHLK